MLRNTFVKSVLIQEFLTSPTSFTDHRCSGRTSCQLDLPDGVLDNTRGQCPDDLEAYLEVTHSCLPVVGGTSSRQRCSKPLEAPGIVGFISNQVTMEKGLGAVDCPWKITGGAGQRITITLLDFGVWRQDGDESK